MNIKNSIGFSNTSKTFNSFKNSDFTFLLSKKKCSCHLRIIWVSHAGSRCTFLRNPKTFFPSPPSFLHEFYNDFLALKKKEVKFTSAHNSARATRSFFSFPCMRCRPYCEKSRVTMCRLSSFSSHRRNFSDLIMEDGAGSEPRTRKSWWERKSVNHPGWGGQINWKWRELRNTCRSLLGLGEDEEI